MRSRYATSDPHWITTRYPGSCSACGGAIARREEACYLPAEHTLLCHDCGAEAWADWAAQANHDPEMAAALHRHSRTTAQEAYAQGDPDLYAQALRGELD